MANKVVPLQQTRTELSEEEVDTILDEIEDDNGKYNTRLLAEKIFTQLHGPNAIEEHPESFSKYLDSAYRTAGVTVTITEDKIAGFGDEVAGRLRFMEAFGLTIVPASEFFLNDIANITSSKAVPNQHAANLAISVVQEIGPRDGIEALLATQMVAVHNATTDVARRLKNANSLEQFKHYERALGRLGKTFASQVEALKKHRSNGSQQINVKHQHVHVSDNAQAVVGDVHAGGKQKNDR
ncbi:MAG: hypothetical protein QNJ29_09905 [Rhizobiaceae bacterium]|nr:hypothetical protein [Rhizobiaceae bacterium]